MLLSQMDFISAFMHIPTILALTICFWSAYSLPSNQVQAELHVHYNIAPEFKSY